MEEAIPEISFHAIAGADHPQTLRVIGTLKNRPFTVLIDRGSTHNFIDQSVVNRFKLPIQQGTHLRVMVANKEHVDCMGKCKALSLQIQGYSITTDFYVLPIAACPIVLGVQWLATLGPIETNYSQLTMSFKTNGTLQVFQG